MLNDAVISRGTLLQGDDLRAEYSRRKTIHLTKSIPKGSPVPDGWQVTREFKTTTRITKAKSVPQELEDKIWRLLHDIGAQKLSSRDFALVLRKRGGLRKTKQIDVFAVDDDIVFVVECKSQALLGRKSLKKDIAELAANLNALRSAARELLGSRELEFVFVMATENIQWDENDRLDAREANILPLDEYDVLALQELAELAGQGAKYQLYSRVLFGKKIKGQ